MDATKPIEDAATEWIPCDRQLPENGKIVETKIDDRWGERNHSYLSRSGRLWFLADGSMYVYYTPTHWRTAGRAALAALAARRASR